MAGFWIQVLCNVLRHRKTAKLADELSLSSPQVKPDIVAVGIVVSLWAWAVENALSGDLSGCSPRSIADACQWKKKPEILINALIKAGFIDEDMRIHNWDLYTLNLFEREEQRKESNRKRQQEKRARDKAARNKHVTVTDSVTASVTEALHNAPTIPNHTEPYQSSSGGDEARTQAQEAVNCFFAERDLVPEAYLGITDEILDELRAFTDELFKRFTSRRPTELDEKAVFQCTMKNAQEADGSWHMELNESLKSLLMYAFEHANSAGKPGDWNYVRGILKRLHARGIKTLADATDFDENRQNY